MTDRKTKESTKHCGLAFIPQAPLTKTVANTVACCGQWQASTENSCCVKHCPWFWKSTVWPIAQDSCSNDSICDSPGHPKLGRVRMIKAINKTKWIVLKMRALAEWWWLSAWGKSSPGPWRHLLSLPQVTWPSATLSSTPQEALTPSCSPHLEKPAMCEISELCTPFCSFLSSALVWYTCLIVLIRTEKTVG